MLSGRTGHIFQSVTYETRWEPVHNHLHYPGSLAFCLRSALRKLAIMLSISM